MIQPHKRPEEEDPRSGLGRDLAIIIMFATTVLVLVLLLSPYN